MNKYDAYILKELDHRANINKRSKASSRYLVLFLLVYQNI